MNAVISRNLAGIDPKWPFFRDKGIDRILYVTGNIPARRKARFADSCEIMRISGNAVVRSILKDFARRGFSCVGVEGGGEVMWPFVEADAIDAYYVTLTPRIVGGRDAPTLVDGRGFDPRGVRTLRLKSIRRFGDEIFLVYVR